MATWANTFFSDNPPEFINEVENCPSFRGFSPGTNQWCLGAHVDRSRRVDSTRIQVFWLQIKGRRDHVAKVFPDYTLDQAARQLWQLRFYEYKIMSQIDKARYEFDPFYREARAYNHIERFCPGNEQIYFPQFHGVLAGLERSRFSSGYAQRRAVVLEAVKPKLRSRRILAADSNPMPKSFLLDIPLSSFEREWYWSLLCDRLRRLAALHRIGILHGDLYDHHFRLPDDFYDTVLFDFSASYTFTPRQPFRVNRGRPRPLEIISEGERTRVELQLQERAELRDFHSYLVDSMTESVVNYALHQSLEKEEGLLEAIILKVWTRPDC
ncbi:hypothetical protein BJX63DRAFT_397930 [Aspergillus granulosus]|uniref:Protein kinase domain-containing protein n=1 Tax=Aspergillus granulosus TaxID=176169 RepID=A0ABR4HAR5_9EURO